tara:strand:+ start:33309 stop:33455 length:147 start_codon:yes stop_codon:yes gene_type:complete
MKSNLQKKAIKHAKKQIARHEGHGVFSTEYYVLLFDKYIEQYLEVMLA